MDIQALMTAISTVGFPIAACCAMGWYVYTTGKQHAQEMDSMAAALNNNTVALQKLSDQIAAQK